MIQFSDQQDVHSELQFQNLNDDTKTSGVATLVPSESYTSFPEPEDFDNEEKNLLGEKKPEPSFWEFSYYQSFFNVDTDQVLQRIMWSMIPLTGRATYLDRVIRPNPDLYGPFWITATLMFSTAISANIADYLASQGQSNKIWHYDFHKVSLAATAIYSYAIILPLLLWGLMWYRQSSTRYTLLEILSVYGYSLFIYIPISILWVIQIPFFQWILVIVGAALSGSVLLMTFWPTVRDENKKVAIAVLCLILLFHTLLAVGFVTYFFQPTVATPSSVVIPPLEPIENVTTKANMISLPEGKESLVSLNQVVSNASHASVHMTTQFVS